MATGTKMKSELPFKRISVVGLGYIGLPTAAMFASCKVEVVGVDVNQQTVDTINQGRINIVEPELDSVVRAVVEDGYLRAVTIPEPADVFLIAVPTPLQGDKREPDLDFIKSAALAIAPLLEGGNLVILESTSPVGATEMMADWMSKVRPDLSFPQDAGAASDIRIAHCPERVLPGKVMQELITNDRVIGGMTPDCSARAISLYKMFVSGECIVASGPRVAEMAKLAENSYRDVNIAFANELSMICDQLDIDVWELIPLANRHPRVDILQPGPGVGGHCIAVDPWFIVSSAPEEANLISVARGVNDGKPDWVLRKIQNAIATHKKLNAQRNTGEITVAFYGLSFKRDIDDLRESPAVSIVRRFMSEQPESVVVVEPHICELPPSLSAARLVSVADARHSEIHVLLVDHSQFRDIKITDGLFVDTRGIWSSSRSESTGL